MSKTPEAGGAARGPGSVVVIGAGVTGLTTAYFLSRYVAPCRLPLPCTCVDTDWDVWFAFVFLLAPRTGLAAQ